ncbi:MAG: transposase [Caldilineaceae bacterium]|nr:transposase [Planctomycetales bacterium]MCB0145856.1 transposase [Caldilineaceae bacterium]
MTTQSTYYSNGQSRRSESESETERPVRRKFSKAYKRRIVKEAAECNHGEVGALLRREGLYSSQLTDWRRQEVRGELAEKSPGKKGAKANADEIAKLQAENERLSRKLEQAELIIEAQKKLSQALEQTLTDTRSKR